MSVTMAIGLGFMVGSLLTLLLVALFSAFNYLWDRMDRNRDIYGNMTSFTDDDSAGHEEIGTGEQSKDE